MTDPRVFFAAERTLLAWVRTGLTIIALGFVIARFSVFVSLLARQTGSAETLGHPPILSSVLGILLVGLGTATMCAAGVQHLKFLRELRRDEMPVRYRTSIALFLAFSLASVGILVAIYLATSVPPG